MLVTSADLVRSSRDGDQFHYYWAARQCLKLLRSGSGLAGVSIEGSSPLDAVAAGEYVVDIAEYYGAVDPLTAVKIVYRQLKHSTVHADEPSGTWTGLACPEFGLRLGADVDNPALQRLAIGGEIADLIWEPPGELTAGHGQLFQAAIQADHAANSQLANQL